MTTIYRDVEGFRAACDAARASGQRVGLVPTMGALHEGHLALVTEAKRRGAGWVAATIFVNPTQFGANEDLAKYPRDLEGDVAKLSRVGADAVFAPTVDQMYPPGDRTRVRVTGLTEVLCGPHRPVHFEGVATIVTKLFALTGSCLAVFGQKDYQQLQVIRRLAADLLLPVEVVGFPTVREPDGLAMSSRNAYLSQEDRQKALALITGLRAAKALFDQGERSAKVLRTTTREPIEKIARAIDYVDVADPDSLEVYADDASVRERVVIAIAAHVGSTRLIDNMVLGD
ncbi:MAG: pantoate--beta-alanine ligase [Polyangiaceae bacterium]